MIINNTFIAAELQILRHTALLMTETKTNRGNTNYEHFGRKTKTSRLLSKKHKLTLGMFSSRAHNYYLVICD